MGARKKSPVHVHVPPPAPKKTTSQQMPKWQAKSGPCSCCKRRNEHKKANKFGVFSGGRRTRCRACGKVAHNKKCAPERTIDEVKENNKQLFTGTKGERKY